MSWMRRCLLLVSAPVLAIILASCVSTPFKGQAASALTDDQLLAELQSVYQQLGMSTAGLYQLRAMMPPPKLVITENSFTTISLDTNFVGDSAYTSGTATTTGTFSTSDQNDVNRSMNQLAQNIQLARINKLNSRRYELEAEARLRIERRQRKEEALHAAVAEFFRAHPLLENERSLLVAILPWEQAASYRETLERVGFEAESVLAARATGRPAGRWYGTFQIRTESPTGARQPSSYPARADLVDSGSGTTLDLHFMSGASAKVMGAVTGDGSLAGHIVLMGKPNPAADSKVLLDTDIAGTVAQGEIRLTFIGLDKETSQNIRGILTLSR